MKIIIETNIETEMLNAGRIFRFFKKSNSDKTIFMKNLWSLVRIFIEISVTVRSYGLILWDYDPSHDKKMAPFKDQSYFYGLFIHVYESGLCKEKKLEILFPLSLLIDM